ncbi:branched-chain amino acid ABC transporter permease [Nocardioides seonyuensis]|nr:branched-chain amino acid ABC transporter permease [Nocardioides seonyuensis]
MHPRVTRPRRQPRLRLHTLLLVIGILAGGLSLVGAPAQAEEEQTNTISGFLRNSAEDNAPVPGVEINVTAPDGSEHVGTSDEEGRFEIEVPGEGGEYSVTINQDTLPEGVTLRDQSKSELTRTLNPGQSAVFLFPIGPDTRDVATKWDRVPQLIYNGLLFGLIIAMASLGLSMIFGTTGLTNFAHGELVTFGALVAFFFNSTLGMPFVVAAVLAVLLGLVFGWVQDTGLWRPLRRRGTGLIAMMIVSIGLQFLLRNLFQYFTGGRTQNYNDYVTPSGYDVAGINVTTRDMVMAAVSVVAIVGVTLALNRTRLGRATRAVADNPALASSTGINVDRVISLVWVVGTALAALAGVFLGFSLGVTFQMGQLVLLLLFAAVCVGGLGSVWGALVGSLIIGVLIELSTLVIPSDLKNAGAMLLLIVILLVRPQGLLGRRERIG